MAAQELPEELEAPEADAAEQALSLDERDAEAAGAPAEPAPMPWEADPADAAEQAVAVPVDEDEYR